MTVAFDRSRIWPGSPQPLGATWDGEGVNFAVFSAHATAVELCLFDAAQGAGETARISLRERTAGVWHCYLPGVRAGQLYGFRAHGPYAPSQGQRFNPKKLLLDPYAKSIAGQVASGNHALGYDGVDDVLSHHDSAPLVPKAIVVDPLFPWGDDRPPRTPWSRTLIYECHVKGMTMRHPAVQPLLRGTYLGLCADPIIEHLRSLGVTAIQLLPVHHSVSERSLTAAGLANYWGYSTIGYLAPDARFATGDHGQQVTEFKSMVKAFHRAGIEVLLDVVYNHTAEGDELGPTLCMRGLDNAVYYRLKPGEPRRYEDTTGCGNTLNLNHPRVLQLVLDSLRYWVTDMHVDGFRFDLAPALARDGAKFEPLGRFLATVQQDPLLSRVKLIAEPWDLGPGGYQLGQFPSGWAEWNDKYRDQVRRFWRGDSGQVAQMASRLSGSSDVFGAQDRGPFASVNYVTCHDGFTLRDLVTYEHKHNEANGQHNRDGSEHNWSRNWGVEGPTDRPQVLRMRRRMLRNFVATLAFSHGVPMLSHGDEVGRTQRGNNNAYCLDDERSWVDWSLAKEQREFLEFVREVLTIRRGNSLFRRRRFFAGGADAGFKDLTWLRSDGAEMQATDWADPQARVIGMLMHGDASDEVDERGRPNRGTSLLLLLNASHRSRYFPLSAPPGPGAWHEQVNTARPPSRAARSKGVNLAAHSLMLLVHDPTAGRQAP